MKTGAELVVLLDQVVGHDAGQFWCNHMVQRGCTGSVSVQETDWDIEWTMFHTYFQMPEIKEAVEDSLSWLVGLRRLLAANEGQKQNSGAGRVQFGHGARI